MPMSKKKCKNDGQKKKHRCTILLKIEIGMHCLLWMRMMIFSWTLEQILWSFVTNRVDGNLDLSNLTHTQKVLFWY